MNKPKLLASSPFRPTVMYVHTDGDYCSSWGGTSYKCEDYEEKTDTSWFLYKCMYCNHDEMMRSSCLATTGSGKRCRRNTNILGYCSEHDSEGRELIASAMEVNMPWRIESIQEFANQVKVIGMLIAKRDILHRIRNMRDISLGVLYEKVVRNQEDCFVYFLRCGNYVKIGSSIDPDVRVEQLRKDTDRTLRPKGLKMSEAVYIGSIAASRSVERDLHNVLNKYRVIGEWFEWTDVVESTVTDVLADEISVKMLIERAIEDPELLERMRLSDANHDANFLDKEIKQVNQELRTLLEKQEEEYEVDYSYRNY